MKSLISKHRVELQRGFVAFLPSSSSSSSSVSIIGRFLANRCPLTGSDVRFFGIPFDATGRDGGAAGRAFITGRCVVPFDFGRGGGADARAGFVDVLDGLAATPEVEVDGVTGFFTAFETLDDVDDAPFFVMLVVVGLGMEGSLFSRSD